MSRRLLALAVLLLPTVARADVGDPQVRTDHPWYPGELACSSFERLFATQAEVYRRVTGVTPVSDEDKALAAWLWRNTHYWHGEEGSQDLWGKGFQGGGDLWTRDYWTGMFAHGFGLCGTTHAQWSAELEALLGHGRGRVVGVEGHNSFEAFLTGGPYGNGRWALLDHDISTVIYNPAGTRLLSLREVRDNWKQLVDRGFKPDRQHGWLVCGLHPGDGASYQKYTTAEYLAGYAGVPPIVHLRRGETLRRYLRPGLEDGKTFVFWGRNDSRGGIPGPERALTWVNQPDTMHGSRTGPTYHDGQARFGNAVYTYRPDFASDGWREGVVESDDKHVVFEFYTPYIIAATPAAAGPWGIYEPGCKNGLVLHGRGDLNVSLSVDQGKTWHDCGRFASGMDLTDWAKGRRQCLLRLGGGPRELATSELEVRTVCQANPCTMPRLKDHGTHVEFAAFDRAVVSAGPNLPQAEAHVVAGKTGTPNVTLELRTPRHESAVTVHAAAHILSGNPPAPEIKYQIEASTDGGKTWRPVVKDWTIPRRGEEPGDFWSQSFCWGQLDLAGADTTSVRVRFRNDGGKAYARVEAHLVYHVSRQDTTRVTFDWNDDTGRHQSAHDAARGNSTWDIPTGRNVQTHWVDFATVPTP